MSALLTAIQAELDAAEAELITATQRVLRARSLSAIAKLQAPVVSLEALAAEIDDDPEEPTEHDVAYAQSLVNAEAQPKANSSDVPASAFYADPPQVDVVAATRARRSRKQTLDGELNAVVLSHLSDEPKASWVIAADAGIEGAEATTILNRLVAGGLARKIGMFKASRYIRAEPQESES